MIYLQLLWVFIKIGVLGFGGGYAMLSLIQHEVVEHYAWMSTTEFADMVDLADDAWTDFNQFSHLRRLYDWRFWRFPTRFVCLMSAIRRYGLSHHPPVYEQEKQRIDGQYAERLETRHCWTHLCSGPLDDEHAEFR